uniref:Uncharacterized protein n=1 Tax=Oryza barthii TaxID=65489 RepID=A0A0D3FKT6_9ORYZ
MSWAIAVPVPSSSRRQKRAAFLVALTPEAAVLLPELPPFPSLPSAPLSSFPSRAHLQHGGSASGAEADGEGDGGAAVELVVQRPPERKKKGKKGEKKGGEGREKEGRREKKIKNFYVIIHVACHVRLRPNKTLDQVDTINQV